MPRIELTIGGEVVASTEVSEEMFAHLQAHPKDVEWLVRETMTHARERMAKDMDHKFITGRWPV